MPIPSATTGASAPDRTPPPPRRRRARAAALALVAGASCAVAAAAWAQMPDLNLLALGWLRGRWASPVVCEQPDGAAQRTLRRVVVSPGPRHARPPTARMAFHGVESNGAVRCSDAVGGPAPDVRGSIQVTLPGTSRPDLARSEFQRAMRQHGGFDFEIESGRLRILGWDTGEDEAEARIVDFEGGTVRAREVRRGSDAARILADLHGPRKLTLEVESADGEARLSYHMVLYDQR